MYYDERLDELAKKKRKIEEARNDSEDDHFRFINQCSNDFMYYWRNDPAVLLALDDVVASVQMDARRIDGAFSDALHEIETETKRLHDAKERSQQQLDQQTSKDDMR